MVADLRLGGGEGRSNWIYGGANQAEIDRRLQKLTKFNKQDRDLHEVVALSMWRLGSSGNFPWGRGATRPSFYCLIPKDRKGCE